MEIPEVKELIFEAVSKDRIKIGCREFTRTQIANARTNAMSSDDLRKHGRVAFHGGRPHWYTIADCERALQLMDEYKEPWVPKVGDWVRCNSSGHYGPNPFQITRIEDGKGAWGAYGNEAWQYCYLRDLSPAEPPKEDRPEPKFKIGDKVRCALHGVFTIGAMYWLSGCRKWCYGWNEKTRANCEESNLELVPEERKPQLSPGKWCSVVTRIVTTFESFRGFHDEWEKWTYNGHASPADFYPKEWIRIEDPPKPELFTGKHWEQIKGVGTSIDRALLDLRDALREHLGRE